MPWQVAQFGLFGWPLPVGGLPWQLVQVTVAFAFQAMVEAVAPLIAAFPPWHQVAEQESVEPATDVVMVDPQGEYLWHRKMQTPLKYHTWTCHLSTLSCAMFFRRRIVAEWGLWLDPRWRDVGDGEWMVRLLRRGARMAALGQFTSAFTQTGANMSAGPNARRENRELLLTAPAWARALRPWWIVHHRLRRLLGGMYSQGPFTYEVFTREDPGHRRRFEVSHPTFRPPA